MRKLIIATAALAFIASPALAQDKQGGSTGPAAQSDTMSKGATSKGTMSKKSSKKSSKSAKKTGEETKQ